MINFPTFPFIAALRASTGASSNSFVSLLYAWTKTQQYHFCPSDPTSLTGFSLTRSVGKGRREPWEWGLLDQIAFTRPLLSPFSILHENLGVVEHEYSNSFLDTIKRATKNVQLVLRLANLFCVLLNEVEWRCCAFYHPRKKTPRKLICCQTGSNVGGKRATRLLQTEWQGFCCLFYYSLTKRNVILILFCFLALLKTWFQPPSTTF